MGGGGSAGCQPDRRVTSLKGLTCQLVKVSKILDVISEGCVARFSAGDGICGRNSRIG